MQKVQKAPKYGKISEFVKADSGNGANLKKMRRNKKKNFIKCEKNY